MAIDPRIIQAITLESAYLCECGLIVDCSTRCACGNEHGLLALAAILNREHTAQLKNDTEPMFMTSINQTVTTVAQKCGIGIDDLKSRKG